MGDGEKYTDLKKQIKLLDLKDKVKLIGHSNRVYEYIKGSLCVIVSSLWEDPGFVIIEAALCNSMIISSNCKNGPTEFLLNGSAGLLFENNRKDELFKKLIEFKTLEKKKFFKKKF